MPMLRRLTAAFFTAHGVAHLVGFLGSWRLADLADPPYTTSILNGAVDVGDIGIRVVGLLWVAAAAAFVVAAIAIWRGGPAWRRATLFAATLSLVVSVVGLPAAVIGVVIDVAVLTALAGLTLVGQAPRRAVAR
jgi:hypothetical protein